VIDYHPFSRALQEDPWPIYQRLRDEAPLFFLPEFDTFFLSRFDDVWNAAADPRLAAGGGVTTLELLLGLRLSEGTGLAILDPPAHTRVRRTLAPFFMPQAARALEEPTRALVRGFLAELLPRGEFDAIGELAMRVSVRVACLILGIPLEDADHLSGTVNASFDRDPEAPGQPESAAAASAALRDYLAKWIGERRRHRAPGEGLVDRLIALEGADGQPLSDEDVLSNLMLLVVGGTETLPKVFAGALERLASHPAQRAAVAADHALVPDAFWEALRTEMPTQMLGRTVREELVLHGERLRPGQKVMFLWACANRDEREFADPHRFDVRRRAPRILSFGHGTHRCLGHNVARMEGRVLLEELLARIPDYEVVAERAVRLRSEFFQGYASLPIRFRPA
jgi:cytochrome P450